MTKILGIGNALVDVLIQLENDIMLSTLGLPKGSMQLVDAAKSKQIQEHSNNLTKQMASGGSAANTIHGLAKLGIDTAFIGTVGEDETGNFFHNDLVNNNITPLLIKSKSPSGIANAMISIDGERTFGTFLGAAIELSAAHLDDNQFTGYDILHVEGYLVQNHELLEATLKKAKNNGLKISIDLASYNVVEDNLEFLKEMVASYVDIVFANEEEAKAFTGMEPEEALIEISKISDIAIIKIGRQGSIIKQGNTTVKIGVREIVPIDTTGAGDLYAAGFLYGLINNLGHSKSGEIGSLLASTVIENIGAKISEENWIRIREEVK
ncbi:MAG: adenosine kinase [Bacteroidetes bacterium]|nr:adenosine kinase [Bacteroidota bacterium]MBL6944463.1 adenosine kinase [Bacteroidales bacterium]